jgi:hypothetical protein
MRPMDIDKIRAIDIALHGLTRADLPYTFYHDETNNIKKLHIDRGSLNIADIKVFVLGGIVHAGPPRCIDLAALRQDLRIQSSAREIKLKHVARGSFLEILTSEKLSMFLQWLTQNDLFVHYSELDPLFWSFVDIIDSILHAEPKLIGRDPISLKSDLTELLRADLASTVQLFDRYGYPSLAGHDRHPFMQGLLDIIERNAGLIDHFNYMMIKGVLQAGRTAPSLAFIEGNVRHLLIDEFAGFYRHRLMLFKYAAHILDEEYTVRDALESVPLISGGVPFKNHRFANSEQEPGIQISDVVAGILGKMHTYFAATPAHEVFETREGLSGASLRNALLLRDLISASHAENIAFQHHIASRYDRLKTDMFLRFEDGLYAG